jgi:RimJ/RimL family protein N-acetyltransferase
MATDLDEIAARIPRLTTERLTLRAHTSGDLPAYGAMWADPEVTRYTTGHPLPLEDVWTRLYKHVGHWAYNGFGSWIVEETATGSFVGEVGIMNRRRSLPGEFADTPESGWIIASAMQGKGYGKEAALRALQWADENVPAAVTMCMIRRENAPSFRVAHALGYGGAVDTEYRGITVSILRRLRPGPPR